MKKYLCLIGVLGVLLCNTANSYAQKVAVKTNLLYDATTTMNLGLEIGLGKKWSLDLSGNYNPWKFDDETRLRHWGVQPELRYWLCEKFNGHFLGLHGHYAKYNVGGMSFLSDNMEHHRYQGHLWGGGISYGYQWLLGNRYIVEDDEKNLACLESVMRSWTTPNIPVPHAAPFRKVRRKTTSARQRLP